IGHIIDEGDVTPQTASSTSFSMHDRRSVGPHVPDEKLANVTYTFSSPVEVSEVKLIQHTNGVTQIEGYAGDPIDTLTSIGKTWSTIGDMTGNTVFNERQVDSFKFPKSGKGKFFKFVVRKTSFPNGYAFYRAFPRNSRHQAYLPLTRR